MKKIFTLLCFLPNLLFGQILDAAIEMEELNILYRGYLNKIHAVVSDKSNKEIILTSKELQITKNDHAIFIAKPIGSNRTATITISLLSDGDTIEVRKVNYRIVSLPTPTLYWGPYEDGSQASIKEKKLFLKYPPGITLNASFNILNWEISVDTSFNASPIGGIGRNISKAEVLLRKVNRPTTISIIITYVGPDEIRRKTSALWDVNSWDETEEPIELEQSGG